MYLQQYHRTTVVCSILPTTVPSFAVLGFDLELGLAAGLEARRICRAFQRHHGCDRTVLRSTDRY